MDSYIEMSINESIRVKEEIMNDSELIASLESIISECVHAFLNDRKLILFGNGGSATDALHMAAELMGRYELEDDSYPVYVLNTNEAMMTAISNDYGYDQIFEKQVNTLARSGDVLIGISTSGSSKNVVQALKCGKNQGAVCIGLSGQNIGDMDAYCDYMIKVPSNRTATIQEAHIMLIHIMCGLIKKRIKMQRSLE